ncbi:MAG TPA: SDR family NAD(P)-dependent oxidoreductase [Sphaerochaeta sp.]|nr:SDR family NAD(P)-dependent oxidoreductase [Sphaerochaeta sp.]HPK63801.1 SDR family NAD(P)-dependent oxidoreductase [Sphaerochaeta sp.]
MTVFEDIKREIPPLIRGLSFDGSLGLIIHTLGPGPSALVLPSPSKGDSMKETAKAWQALFDEYVKKERVYPATVGVGELRYGLGTNYDEAVRGEGVSKLPTLPPALTRSDVVRDKVAVVTGGAQGFGEGMVRSLVDHGAFVYVADLNREGAQALASELNYDAMITVAKAVEVNVTDEASVQAMMDTVVSEVGGVDLFISNAGVLRAGSVKTMSLKDFAFVTDVDYTGFFICTKFASRTMAIQNIPSGAYYTDIVTISSKSGLEGSNKNGAYAGAKFGTIGLTQSFALELVEDNIKVNAVCPGNFLDGPLWSDPKRGLFVQYLETNKVPGAKTIEDVRRAYEAKVPMNRGCTTADVMKAIFYIVEQTYETGQAVPVTGGQVMLN